MRLLDIMRGTLKEVHHPTPYTVRW